jgi:hypothetical protein
MNRRSFMQLGSAALAACAIPASTFLTGCTTSIQKTASALIGIVGTSITALFVLIPNADPALIGKIQAAITAAQTAVTNWQIGTPTQDIQQVLLLLQSDISLIPIAPLYQALIELALGAVRQVIALFNTPGTTAAAIKAHVQATSVETAAQYKAQWDAIVLANPQLAAVKI